MKTSKIYKSISELQYKTAINEHGTISDKMKEVCHEILVKGRSASSVAEEYGLARQSAHRVAVSLYETHKKVKQMRGYRTATITLPRELMDTAQKWEKDALKELRKQIKEKQKGK